MEKALSRKKAFLLLSVMCVVVLIVGLVACAPSTSTPTTDSKDTTTETKKEVLPPEPDEFGVIVADDWEETYPDEYSSFSMNDENSPTGKMDYLKEYPYLSVLYAGNAFSKGYDEAAGHPYSLESVANTPRISDATLANCITCKTPQYTALVNTNGPTEYSKPFADMIGEFTEPISCYNCHENDPETLTVGNKFFVTALGNDVSKVDVESQVCGQCHNEYFFSGENKAVTNPYTGLAAMDPEAMLKYYDDKGFSDWTYPVTGTPMIKIQHPEFETYYNTVNTSRMADQGYNCADCHMGTATNSNGEEYKSHNLQSPLDNEDLIKSTCSNCHKDIKKQVAEWQEESEARVNTIGPKIADLATKMTEGVNAGTLAGDQLAQLQKLHRTAQFYWDFVFVENSEGVHNQAMAMDTLDKAEAAVDQALAML